MRLWNPWEQYIMMSPLTLVLRACAVVCLAYQMTLQAEVDLEPNATEDPRKEVLGIDVQVYTTNPGDGGLEDAHGLIRVSGRCRNDILKPEGQSGKDKWNTTQQRSHNGEPGKRLPPGRSSSFGNGVGVVRSFREIMSSILDRRGRFRGDLGKRFGEEETAAAVGKTPNGI